jgi:hypothetical protein
MSVQGERGWSALSSSFASHSPRDEMLAVVMLGVGGGSWLLECRRFGFAGTASVLGYDTEV